MDIKRSGSQPSGKGQIEYFTGMVRVDPLIQANDPVRTSSASVTFEPGEKHWHGATPTTAVTHIAIQEALNGKGVDWMEKVSDEQYQAR